MDLRPLAVDPTSLDGIRTLKVTASYYRRIARQLCGPLVASQSWLAVVFVQGSQSTKLGFYSTFLAPTASGWKLWYVLGASR